MGIFKYDSGLNILVSRPAYLNQLSFMSDIDVQLPTAFGMFSVNS